MSLNHLSNYVFNFYKIFAHMLAAAIHTVNKSIFDITTSTAICASDSFYFNELRCYISFYLYFICIVFTGHLL